MSDIRAEKKAIRDAVRDVARAVHTDAVVGHLKAWPPLRGRVMTYLAMGDEIDLAGLGTLDQCEFLAPRIDENNTLAIHRLLPDELVRHKYGFDEPSETSPTVLPDDVDVVLVPGRAFDVAGNRLGRGAGYYDNLISRLPKGVALVGITVDATIVDHIPTESHDQQVHWLATESGVCRVGSALPEDTERFVQAAVAAGIAAAPIRFPEGTKTSQDAANAIGCDLGAIAKSLVFLVDDKPVLVIASGDRRIDEARLASIMGAKKAHPAPMSQVREITGYAVGGTPAVGHQTPLPTLLDTSLGRYRWVWSAAGTPETVYPVSLERLVDATHARMVSLTTEE